MGPEGPAGLSTNVAELVAGIAALRTEVEQLSDAVVESNRVATRRIRQLAVTVLIAVLLAMAGAYGIVRWSNHRFCGVIETVVDPTQPAPTTDRGRAQLERFVRLGQSLGCNV